MDRRSFIKSAVFAAATPVVLNEAKELDMNTFLREATPAELVRYHSNALMEAMAAKYPEERGWRAETSIEHKFVLIVPQMAAA